MKSLAAYRINGCRKYLTYKTHRSYYLGFEKATATYFIQLNANMSLSSYRQQSEHTDGFSEKFSEKQGEAGSDGCHYL